MKAFGLILLTLVFCSCDKLAQDDETPVEVFSQFAAGEEISKVVAELGLQNSEVRYRPGSSGGDISAVYFAENGNVHIEARNRNGKVTLRSSPFFEPLAGTVAERVAAWDHAADSPQSPTKSKR